MSVCHHRARKYLKHLSSIWPLPTGAKFLQGIYASKEAFLSELFILVILKDMTVFPMRSVAGQHSSWRYFLEPRLSELPRFIVKTSWISAGALNYDRRVDNLSTELTPNNSHPVFGTKPNPEWTGRDPWVSAEHIFVFFLFFFPLRPAASVLTVKRGTLEGETQK